MIHYKQNFQILKVFIKKRNKIDIALFPYY